MNDDLFQVDLIGNEATGLSGAWKATRAHAIDALRLPILVIDDSEFCCPLILLRAVDIPLVAERAEELERAVSAAL